MAILAGIDEAGYGPVLGPLVVSGVVYNVPESALEECLWTRLSGSVARTASRRDLRLPILDSKKLYNRKAGLGALERSALTGLRVCGVRPCSLRDLLHALCPHVVAQLDAYPWYHDFDVDLPVAAGAGQIATQANALRRDCQAKAVTLERVYCEPLLEGHYNRLVSRTRNKAVVLLGLVLRIVDRLVRESAEQRIRLCVDRHGGRSHYADALLTAFEGVELHVVEESSAQSAYLLRLHGAELAIEFVTSGEERHLPVAHASIVSKYIRELLMIGLNRFWQQHVEGLHPTAGYYADGRRFLVDIDSALDRIGVDRALLVRQR